ncbi:MAG: DUF177 domain-containing protein [Geminicoccaceae bacterium]
MAALNEFSRTFLVDPLPEGGLDFDLVANAAERTAVARRLDILALDRLEADGRIDRDSATGGVVVSGTLRAAATQRCVVTLEPVPQAIDTEFRRLFAAEADAAGDEIEIDPLAEQPEPLDGSLLDVGELVTEELSLALDPYPRATGVPEVAVGDVEAEPSGPFAALSRLRPS